VDEATIRSEKAIRTLTTLAGASPGTLVSPERMIAEIGTHLASLPEDRAARAAVGTARRYARPGRWDLARQLYLLAVSRYPASPEVAEACRWLIEHDTSAEIRRRLELKQFKVHTQVVYSHNSAEERTIQPAFAEAAAGKVQGTVEVLASQEVSLLG